jgi:hypothetical protein
VDRQHARARVGGDGPSPFGGLLVAAAAWGLAEFFTRRRRMALPSILLLLAFILGTMATVAITLTLAIGQRNFQGDSSQLGFAVLAAPPLPVQPGPGSTGGAFECRSRSLPARRPWSASCSQAWPSSDGRRLDRILLSLALVAGVVVFLFAMWWDSSDPRRETRRSDVAFWLHLLAAPLIVHPIFTLLGLNDGNANPGEAMVVLIVYVLLGLAALAIDRRALLVSALAYVLWAISDLFEEAGAVELNLALTALVIGSALLLLSAFWNNARRAIVRPLPPGLQAKLPVLDRISAAPAAV